MVTALKSRKAPVKRHAKKTGMLSRLKQHYWTRMPDKKRHRVMIWAAFLVISASIAAQMAYPQDRALPLASVAGSSQAAASYNTMAKVVTEQFDKTKVKLVVGKDKSVEFPIKTMGAEPDTEVMIARMTEYPFWQRFIPGSIVWQPVQVREADIFFTGKPFDVFVAEQAKTLSFAPKNAHIAIKNDTIETTSEVAGSEVKADDLKKAIGNAHITLGGTTVVEVPARRIEPTEKTSDLEKVRSQAELALAHTAVIVAGDQKFTPDKKEIASWLVLGTNPEGRTTLTIDREKIRAYVGGINEKVGVTAGQTNITIVDGREVGRTAGVVGRAVNGDKIIDQLAEALLRQPLAITVNAEFQETQPSVIFNSRYTATQAGLQAYVEDIARAKNMHIMIQQLDGGRWSAHARETESIPSASTYKVYIAKILFDKIDAGEIHWSDPMLDTDVAGCFERMTVASTNPCAQSWIAQWGRDYINNYVYGLGFSTGTSFTTGGAVQTTAADLNRYMTGLYNGTILTGANRDRLLDSLGRHPYRYGIPTGSAGIVHDKVGFLWDYVHDAAIVQHPRGTYIMTIMSKGQSYAAIAAVTREVERIMYP